MFTCCRDFFFICIAACAGVNSLACFAAGGSCYFFSVAVTGCFYSTFLGCTACAGESDYTSFGAGRFGGDFAVVPAVFNREGLITTGSTADGASHLCNACLFAGCFSDGLVYYEVMCFGILCGFAALCNIFVAAYGADHFGISFCAAGGSHYVFFVVVTEFCGFIVGFGYTASSTCFGGVTSFGAGGFGYNALTPGVTKTSTVTGVFSVGITAYRAGVLNCFTSQTAGFDYFPFVVVTVGFAYRSKLGCIAANRAYLADLFRFGAGCVYD